MSNFILLATVCFLQLVVHSPGHIVLTYPPARKFALDFLDNANTRGPCGMPKGLGPVTSLLTNSALNITWHLAYPHQGGFFIELLNSRNHLQQKLTAGEYTAAEDATTLYWSVNLPQNVTCKNCIIRIVREAKEWVLRNKGVYLFWSCADVNILPASEFRETCSGNGNFSGSKCQCKRLFSGTKCENKDDCWTDSDCSNHGECIKTKSTYFPKSQCYCNFGWFGTHCERNSKIKSRVVDYSLYKMTKMSKRYTMYHRILKSEREIEVILQVDTKTWVALGWRPLGGIKNCRSFPVNFAQPEPEAEAEAEPEAEAEAESTPEPESESTPEPESESTPEPESESTPEPESESTPEPHAEPKHEPEPEPEAEPGADYFHPMDCTDMVIGSAKGEMSRIGDYYTRDRSTPKEDYFYGGTHSLTAALGYEKNGKTIIIFRKQIESNEKQDHGFENDKMHVIWAHGQDEGKYSHQTTSGLEQKSTSDKHYYKEDELKYHGGSEHRGTRRLNFIGEKVMKSYRISIKVSSITWTADFRNKQSKKYREMADRLEKQLMSVFHSVPDLEKVHINNLRAGSIIVDFTVSVMTGLGNERKVRNAVVTVFLGLLKNRTLGNEALDSSYFYLVGPEGENMFDCKKQPTNDHFNHLLTLEILIGVMAAFVIVSILIGISKGCHDWKTAPKEFDKSKL